MNSGSSSSQGHAQQKALDGGIACLTLLARYHGIAADPDQLAHEYVADGQALSSMQMLLAAKKLGLTVKLQSPRIERLANTPSPLVSIAKDGSFFVLGRVSEKDGVRSFLIQDPTVGRPQILSENEFVGRWSGVVIVAASRGSTLAELKRFDFTWFIPAIVKYRKLLGEVVLVSLVIQVLALVSPLFFQVVMDKVLVHKGLMTLDVIVVGLIVVTAFEVLLGGLRTFVFSHTSSRIDVELGARLFRHVLALPSAYFHARKVGDSVARIRELESIRSFLTGNAVTVGLDLAFSFVFIAVMFLYSTKLTLLVLLSLPCYFILSAVLTPLLRGRLNEKFARGAENQAFLMETISGIDTVKAMAVEPQWTRTWDNQLASYVSAGFRASNVSAVAQSGVTLVSKLVTAATLWFGARFVIDGSLSVGQLIAFNMFAGHVSTPIIRLAQLWTDFQQVGISMQRLGDILNTRPEIAHAKTSLPRVKGDITFENVHFRYRPDGQLVVRGLSVQVAQGEIVGVVGRSGSGKSTLARLLLRLHVPEEGRVLVDGVDISVVDPSSLRRQIGVVMQEATLFGRSIRDNIALADPGAPLDSVVRASKLAGAHEFITQLPEGYDTVLGERGTGLSGGQRQRIAIARALITDPRVLIFDEATSALDYESERSIQENMAQICNGRTVIIIAHRLTAVQGAHRILFVENGQIAESGSHVELLADSQSRYARLHRMQGG